MIKMTKVLDNVRQAPIFYHHHDLMLNAWNPKQKKRKKNHQNKSNIRKKPPHQKRVKKLALRDN